MKCLEYDTSKSLLAEWGIQVAQARQLEFQHKKEEIQLVLPKEPLPMLYFAEDIAEWLPKDSHRFIWPAHWETYPRSPTRLIEKIRSSYGDTRPLIESPGMLFDKENETENEVFSGIFFLMMAFDWSGYLITKNHSDYVYIFDTLAKFSCSTSEKAAEILKIADKFKLEIMK